MFKRILILIFILCFMPIVCLADALINYPKFQAFDSSGDPLSGGLLYTYEYGTTTAKATYSDRECTTANANPIVLDSRGEATIYGDGKYKFVLKDSDGTTIWTFDNLSQVSASYEGSNYYFPDPSR